MFKVKCTVVKSEVSFSYLESQVPKTVTDFLNCPKLISQIKTELDEVSSKAISRPQVVQKFRILPREFSMAGGELGPTMKVKRFFVLEKYQDVIDEMYQ